MGVNAFVFPVQDKELDKHFIANQFLYSDFDTKSVKQIYNDLGKSYPTGAKHKNQLTSHLASMCIDSKLVRDIVMSNLLTRGHNWLTIKKGLISTLPQLKAPSELVTSIGYEEWYGPLEHPTDNGTWYIRPVFVEHWEQRNGKTSLSKIRLLCLVRIEDNFISLHWKGFTHSDSYEVATKSNRQYPYWDQIPAIFQEFQELLNIQLTDIDLHTLILHDLWDVYRYNDRYEWIDRRIRAESGGVALNARAGNIKELSIAGIRGLAQTIRESISNELERKYGGGLPDPNMIDEVILRTLLREYGTLSYECSLEDKRIKEKVYRAHAYFGQRNSKADCFPHLNVYTTWQTDLQLLQFLLEHIRMKDASNRQITQASLFG